MESKAESIRGEPVVLGGRTNGDSVTQTEGPVILSEGSPLTLNCSYQTSSSVFLFWYVQYLHEGPQLLLKSAIENQRVEHEGFHATLVKKDSSFHLHKSSLQLSDSAVYYCALRDTILVKISSPTFSLDCPVDIFLNYNTLIILGRTNGDSVTQTEGPVILSEGSSLTLNCNYQTSYLDVLFWYVQHIHQGPQLLLKSGTENQRMKHEGFHATLVKKDSSFHLHKSSLQLSDSAVYYCALRDTVRGTTEGAEHKPRGVQLRAGGGQPWEGRARFPSKVTRCLRTLAGKEQIPALMF
nr:uncharacterized protein LOC103351230 [Oryctolagus cuniculus]